jgi:membrane-associated protein
MNIVARELIKKNDRMLNMNFLKFLLDFFLHIDKNLAEVIQNFGGWSYGIMWAVIFIETGLVIMPFLPGDSLLFAAGALSASLNAFDIKLLWVLMVTAAFIGDTVNYWIGHYIGPKAFAMNSKLLKKEYLDKAQAFYDKHGGKAIVLARFVPIVRTFAPFVAGVSKMNYSKFISYNAIGGLAWVSIFLFSGFFFGNIPIVKDNFHYVALGIVLVSVVPIGLEWWKGRKKV